MMIDSINTKAADPIRMVSSVVDSEATAQVSSSGDKEASQPRKAIEKEVRSAEEIKKDLDVINAQMKNMNRSIQFTVDDSSHDIVVRVVDRDSGEVIRELPPESVIRLREHMTEVSGLIFEGEV